LCRTEVHEVWKELEKLMHARYRRILAVMEPMEETRLGTFG
jgi:hypothetical protein